MSPIEITAVLLGLTCVWLTVRQNIWCWPAGIGMVTLYIVIFFEARLYSDMGLQVIYVFLQLYGWQQWLRGGDSGTPLQVSRLTTKSASAWLATAVFGTGVLGGSMAHFTNADLPYWDAATTVLSLIAQWLMGRKVLESWVVWIIVDVLSVGIYFAKGLDLTAGLYTVFLVLAVLGLTAWQRTPVLQPA